MYYAHLGLNNVSGVVRACALAIFTDISKLNPNLIYPTINRVSSLVEDSWWEVKAQLII